MSDVMETIDAAKEMLRDGGRIEIDTDIRTKSWDVGVGDDEPVFLGVPDYELDELKEKLGFLVLESTKGANYYTMHERPVEVAADLLRQMIMTCERYTASRKAAAVG